MKTHIDGRFIYLRNRIGQGCTLEIAAEGRVVRESDDFPPYDWQGVYVEDIEVTEISFWLDDDDTCKEFKLNMNQLAKVLDHEQMQKFENKVDELLQEEACQNM